MRDFVRTGFGPRPRKRTSPFLAALLRPVSRRPAFRAARGFGDRAPRAFDSVAGCVRRPGYPAPGDARPSLLARPTRIVPLVDIQDWSGSRGVDPGKALLFIRAIEEGS